MAAIVISAAGGNWNATASWSPAQVPVAGDTVTAIAGSGNLTINVASACASIILTNYVNTLTFNASLTVNGSVTFVAGQAALVGTGSLIITGTGTLTSGGKILLGTLDLGGTTTTYALGDNWSVKNLWTSNVVTSCTINSNTLSVSGNFQAGISAGTSLIKLTGTGTWSSVSGVTQNNVTINPTGVITISGTIYYDTGTLTYTASTGSVVATGGELYIQASTTLNTNGITWGQVVVHVASTINLTSNLTINGVGLYLERSTTFTGTGVFTTNNLWCITGGHNNNITIILVSAQTYTVTTSITMNGVIGAIVTVRSSISSTKAIFICAMTVSPYVVYVTATDIDSSAGTTIYDYKATLTNTLNWNILPLATIAY